jgi:hypothetical protein
LGGNDRLLILHKSLYIMEACRIKAANLVLRMRVGPNLSLAESTVFQKAVMQQLETLIKPRDW